MVRLTGNGRYVPACGTRVEDGMQVASEVPDVHRLRRTALELLLSDHVGDCLAPCFFACPAHMDIQGMLRQIGDQDLRGAIATIKEDIALPAVLGRVCPKPCEKGCRRNAADGPVEVCDLKRRVADRDLASASPYLPACRPDTGRRALVVGGGPTGLAAAYHLRRDGHDVTLVDRRERPGGRLLEEFTADALPPETLEAEIGVILRMGVQFQAGIRLGQDLALDDACEQYDAVLLACGPVDRTEVEAWGIACAQRGIRARAGTFKTDRKGVFAAGNAVRGKTMVVRNVADGKEAAAAISQYLAGKEPTPAGRPFSSRIGRVGPEEMPEFLAAADPAPRLAASPAEMDGLPAEMAARQAHRCLACGCAKHGDCKLERYAEMYGAQPGRYQSDRRAFVQVNRGGSVIYEPGKCINCELCVQIASEAKDALGLTFVGRGFDVRVGVPFGGTVEEGLGDVAARCVAACPTGALVFAPVTGQLVQLQTVEPLGSPSSEAPLS
jgi:ferredoxin